jgi:hypothetical protein
MCFAIFCETIVLCFLTRREKTGLSDLFYFLYYNVLRTSVHWIPFNEMTFDINFFIEINMYPKYLIKLNKKGHKCFMFKVILGS